MAVILLATCMQDIEIKIQSFLKAVNYLAVVMGH